MQNMQFMQIMTPICKICTLDFQVADGVIPSQSLPSGAGFESVWHRVALH